MTRDKQMAEEPKGGPWWAAILTNRNAVVAAIALYFVYLFGSLFTASFQNMNQVHAQLATQQSTLEAKMGTHDAGVQVQYDKITELLRRLNDQAVLQTRLARITCVRNARNQQERDLCLDPDVR